MPRLFAIALTFAAALSLSHAAHLRPVATSSLSSSSSSSSSSVSYLSHLRRLLSIADPLEPKQQEQQQQQDVEPLQFSSLVLRPHEAAVLETAAAVHALDNVGPALANATQSALSAGEQLLTRYADMLRLVAIPCGLAICFFGYFLLGPVLFVSGFLVGGASCFVAVYAVLDTHSDATAWLAIIASVVGGALLAFLALHALPVGLFAAGASLGLVAASALRPVVLPHFFPRNPRLAFIIAAVLCAVVFGMLALVVQKQMLIFSTAYGGAGAAAYGAGRFLRHFPSGKDVGNLVEKGRVDAWLLLYAVVALGCGTVGLLFQSWLARDRPMHERAPRERRRPYRSGSRRGGTGAGISLRRGRRSRAAAADDAEWWDDEDEDWVPNPHRGRERVPLSVHKAQPTARGAAGRTDAQKAPRIVDGLDDDDEGETNAKNAGVVANVV